MDIGAVLPIICGEVSVGRERFLPVYELLETPANKSSCFL
jgi:hypothetical protein